MEANIQIEAKNKKEALKKGKQELEVKLSKSINKDDLTIDLIEKKKGFLGLFKNGKSIYEVSLKDSSKTDENLNNNINQISDEISIDGKFKIRVHPQGIYLKVIPAEGNGKNVSYQEVKKDLEDKRIEEVDKQEVQQTIRDRGEKWVKIAPRKPELDQDATASVTIDQNQLKAYLDYEPALGGKKLTLDDLHKTLEEAGITYGIKEDKLKQVIKYREKQKELLIAEGKEPGPGKDAKIIYHFEDKDESIGTKREDGSMDFYNLGLINNVEPGDKLVSKEDPKPGKPGKSVTGKEIPPPKPKDKKLPAGKNVEQEDEYTLVSEIEGQVVKDGKKVKVLPIHEINGNVDINTGNIDFVGNVYVKGNVEEGFSIKAEGNVEVRGRVGAADIESGGEVVVHKGFVGKDKGKISARGTVKIKFVENGMIKSEESIIVSDAVMHSHLVAEEDIIVTERKGLLVGGNCRAGHHIEANIIGSTMATITKIEAGVNPECKERLQELEEELEQLEQNLLKTKRALQAMENIKDKIGKLPTDKEITYHRLKKTKKKIEKSISDKKFEEEGLKDKLENMAQGKIKVNEKVYSGVKMTIGSSQYNVHEELRKSSFIREDGEVRQIPH